MPDHVGEVVSEGGSFASKVEPVRLGEAERQLLFVTVVQLSNFAEAHGLEETAVKLEAALDSLM